MTVALSFRVSFDVEGGRVPRQSVLHGDVPSVPALGPPDSAPALAAARSCAATPSLTQSVLGLGWPMGWIGLGRVGSTVPKVLTFWKDYVDAFKARLDTIWLHQAVKFVSCIVLGRDWVRIFPFEMDWVGLDWVGSVSWWVGLDRVTQNGPMDNSALTETRSLTEVRL